MTNASLADRLGRIAALSNAERNALAAIETRVRHFRAGAVLVEQGERPCELHVVARGSLAARVAATEGWRRLTRVYLPGDLVNAATLALRESRESVVALTDGVACRIDRAALGQVLADHPRLAMLLMIDEQVERQALTERLIGIETLPPAARMAGWLLDLRDRLRAIDPAITTRFTSPLNPEQLGEAVALRPAEALNVLAKLRDDGLIVREADRITISDERALERLAGRGAPVRGDLGWLPRRA